MISNNRFRKPLTVKRLSGQYVDGRWDESQVIEFEILASLQPVTGSNEAKMLPEGSIERGTFRIYTNTYLVTGEDDSSDIAVINSEDYKVLKHDNWNNSLIKHNKYYAVRVSGV